MIQIEAMKTVPLFNPISVTTAASASGTIDTEGFNHATFLTILDTAATNPTALVLGEGDVTDSFTDITAFVGDTAYTIPAVDTDDPQIVRFEVDLTARKRYLELAVTTGITQVLAAVCVLSKASILPDSNSEWGVSEMVQG